MDPFAKKVMTTTVEAKPETITPDKVAMFVKATSNEDEANAALMQILLNSTIAVESKDEVYGLMFDRALNG